MSLVVVVSVLSVACGGTGGPAEPIGNVPSETLASTVLSSVTLDNGETVEFRAYGNDRVAVVDIFKYGQHQAVPANAETMTLSQIYASVAPGPDRVVSGKASEELSHFAGRFGSLKWWAKGATVHGEGCFRSRSNS